MNYTDDINVIVNNYYKKTDILYKLAKFFNNRLLYNKKAFDYCNVTRGFVKKTIDTFLIGYGEGSLYLHTFIENERIDINDLVNLGIFSLNEDGSYYNKFNKRIIFPIFDLKGNVVALSGRIFKEDDTRHKYIISNLSEIFQKSLNLYGLYQNLENIIKYKLAVVVEGNVDVITCYQEGIKVVVSSLGTSFLKEHFKLLSQFVKVILFCFDNDEAGMKAKEKVKELLSYINKDDIKIGYLQLLGAKDPDEFINKFGVTPLMNSIVNLYNSLY